MALLMSWGDVIGLWTHEQPTCASSARWSTSDDDD